MQHENLTSGRPATPARSSETAARAARSKLRNALWEASGHMTYRDLFDFVDGVLNECMADDH